MNNIVTDKASPEELKKYADWLKGFADSPLDAVHALWPWQKKGTPLENEPGPDTWQTKALNEIGVQIRAGEPVIRLAVKSGHGVGKIQKNQTVTPTPSGSRLWGDIEVGDELFDADGKPTIVTHKFPHKNWEFYKITFDDGSYTYCGKEHLWNVRGRQERRKNLPGWRTMSLCELMVFGIKRPNGTAEARQWEIPIQGSVEFNARDTALHPYLMGVWLGDGTHCEPVYTNYPQYSAITDKIISLGYRVSTHANHSRRILGVNDIFKSPEFHRYADTKYIPDEYKFNSIEARMELFGGLLDTDGEVHSHTGTIGYSSTSKQLIEDVIWLARSLGCKAQLQPTNRKGWYPDKDTGERVYCKLCYRATINAPFNPFTVAHKKDRFKISESRYLKRWIDSVEYSHREDGHCVIVDNDRHLYQTNDFIVTHNSTLVSWMTHTFESCRYNAQTVVTANTATQLKTKTWRELAKWHKLSINSWMFTWSATAYKCVLSPETWYAQAIPWNEANPEAFAGLHEKHVLIQFDESSAISDVIWEVAEGALTTPGAIFLCYGNPTRNSGRFYRITTNPKSGWKTISVDSREARHRNDALIQGWLEEWGEDSDFFRVRVRGLPPKHGSLQMISSQSVLDAMNRHIPDDVVPREFPLIMGVDVARQGDNESVVIMRRWRKMNHNIRRYRISNIFLLSQEINLLINKYRPDAVFVDGVGLGAGVVDSLIQHFGHSNIFEVQAGARPVGGKKKQKVYLNLRIQMWAKMAKWIDGADLPNKQDSEASEDMEIQLTSPEYGFMANSDKMKLESKKELSARTGISPDIADALALTFAQDLPPKAGGSYLVGGSEEPEHV